MRVEFVMCGFLSYVYGDDCRIVYKACLVCSYVIIIGQGSSYIVCACWLWWR